MLDDMSGSTVLGGHLLALLLVSDSLLLNLLGVALLLGLSKAEMHFCQIAYYLIMTETFDQASNQWLAIPLGHSSGSQFPHR